MGNIKQVQMKAISSVECGMRCLRKYTTDESCTAIIFEEDSSICTLAPLLVIPTGLRLAWASSVYGSGNGYGNKAWYAIDRNEKPGSISFSSLEDLHPWFAIDLLLSQEVKQVEIVEREVMAWRSNNIEVRVGNTKPFDSLTNGDIIYTSNSFCGLFIGPGINGDTSIITCSVPLVGRYITLQRITGVTDPINWREIIIRFTPMESKRIEVLKMDVEKVDAHAECPEGVGLTECPKTHPYSFRQGEFCCSINIDFQHRFTAQPLLNFDSWNCRDSEGIDHFTTCDLPPCINYKCFRYSCYVFNKDLSGGELYIYLVIT